MLNLLALFHALWVRRRLRATALGGLLLAHAAALVFWRIAPPTWIAIPALIIAVVLFRIYAEWQNV